MELEGVEPSSKQIAEVLSTRLAGYWLSDKARKTAPKPYRISFISSRRRSFATTSPKLRAPCDPAGIRHLHRQNVLSRNLVPGLSHFPTQSGLGSKSEVIFATWNFADDIYEHICKARRAYTTTYPLSKPVSPEEGVSLSVQVKCGCDFYIAKSVQR